MNPKVSVIIANYNGEEFLSTCLNSIAVTAYKNFEVIVVDDGSTDNSISIINSFKNKINLILLRQEHGGASLARNLAIKSTTSDVVIFLDNDTEVTTNWIEEILISLYSSTDVGATQAFLIDFQDRSKIQSAGIKLIPHVCWGVSIGQGSKDFAKHKNMTNISAISACLAVKREVLNKIGGFDEVLAVSTEDLDFVWRIWIAGYRVVLSPNALVFHYTKTMDMRANMNVNFEKQYFILTRNSLISLTKNYSALYWLWYFPQCLAINLARGVLIVIRRQSLEGIRGTLMGIRFYLNNLPYVLKGRNKIQKIRRFSDKYISEKIMISDSIFDVPKRYYSGSDLV